MNKSELIKLVENYLTQYPDDIHGLNVLNYLQTNEDFWQRTNVKGHITASSWVLNFDRTKALLTHHIGLDKWFQLGGHIEPSDTNILVAAERELHEESGLTHFQIISSEIFDIDVHEIPLNKKGVPAHFHYDIRILIEADDYEEIICQIEESNEITWVELDKINKKTEEWSVLRMVKKSRKL